MDKIKELQKIFEKAIKWNAIFFAIQKTSSTILTLIIFAKLSTQDFNIWANIFCTIYLALLWLDFGFRKSLPLYGPYFSSDTKLLRKFLNNIIKFQCTILLVLAISFIIFSEYLTAKLNLISKAEIFYLGCALFLSEGILAIIRLVYHSYFKQKEFNLIMSIIVTVKSFVLAYFIISISQSYTLLKTVIFLELLFSIIAIAIFFIKIKSLYISQNKYHGVETQKNLTAGFILHSFIMWLNNTIKSFSERNFAMLFFTCIFGPLQANIFKITNDFALLIQRIFVKTIGTTDTSVLSYTQIIQDGYPAKVSYDEKDKCADWLAKSQRQVMQNTFNNLIKKISYICVPLLAVLFFIAYNFEGLLGRGFNSKLFIFLSCVYLIECILSPYERFLEVKRNYLALTLSYLPYLGIIILITIFRFAIISNIFSMVFIIQVSRLLIYLIMIFVVKNKYRLSFPFWSVFKILLYCCFVFFATSFIFKALTN